MGLQVVVYENGRSGFLGEHSCMDGTPTLRMNEFILASLAAGKVDLGPATFDRAALPPVQELTFEINDAVKDAVKGSEKRFDELVGKHDLHVRLLHPGRPFCLLTWLIGCPIRGLRQELLQTP